LEVAAAGNSTAKHSDQHPFANVIPLRYPLITKDLEIIQQTLVVYNDVGEEGFTTVVSKSHRKKNKGYQTRSKGSIPTSSQ
jgi:hypothetical protein